MDDIVKDFLIESNENLSRLDQEFVLLEKQSTDRNLLASIFRTVHTIKGSAGFFNFTKLVSITHFAEDILAKMRDGKIVVQPPIVDALLASIDAVKQVLSSIEATDGEGSFEFKDVVDRLKVISLSDGMIIPDKEDMAKPVSTPAPVSAEVAVAKVSSESTSKSAPDSTVHEPAVESSSAKEKMEVKAIPAPVPQVAVQVSAKASASILQPPAMSEQAWLKAAESALEKPVSETAPVVQAQAPAQGELAHSAVADSTIRVEVILLDKLMNLVGELVLARNQILQFASVLESRAILAPSQRLNLITTELQEQVMKTRMQPVGGVWNKLPRMVRDVANALNKEVDIQLEGQGTELDKTILEAVKDPFTHIVRNSIDHGIETPEERMSKGKSRRGLVKLRAFHEGGQVNIEISDDGTGINIQKVKRKAVQQGLITEEQAQRMGEREALHLIFRPGFSTADKITSISGRGVGMDVVKTNIEKIGGVVDVLNNPGQGSTIKIKIPLTLAIIPALIVSAKDERFAIPQINLRELVRLEGEAAQKGIEKVHGIEVYRLRGNLLPLLRLRNILKLDGDQVPPPSDVINIVVLAADNRLMGLVVDGVNDTEEIVVKPLSKQLKNIHVFAGATIMGDGRVALILDAVGIAQAAQVFNDNLQRAQEKNNAENIAEDDADSTDLLLFKLDERSRFAMPLAMVSRLEEFAADKVEHSNDHDVIQYRGRVMPLIRTSEFLGVASAPSKETLSVIVIGDGSNTAGLIVHQILDVVKERSRPTKDSNRPGVLGTAIIQGHTTVFVDPYSIMEQADPGFFHRIGQNEAGKIHVGQKVLLIEDSAFYRNIERSYLHLAGYKVIEARDGREALERLRNITVDIVLCDLEMPEMNGCQFAQEMRQDVRHKDIPIIALISVGEEVSEESRALFNDCQVKVDREQVLKSVEHLLSPKLLTMSH